MVADPRPGLFLDCNSVIAVIFSKDSGQRVKAKVKDKIRSRRYGLAS